MSDEASLVRRTGEGAVAAETRLPSRLHPGTENHAPWVWVNGDLVRSESLRMQEIFLTGTAAEVTPVASLDDRPIAGVGNGVTARLQRAFFDCVRGRDPRHAGWLSHA